MEYLVGASSHVSLFKCLGIWMLILCARFYSWRRYCNKHQIRLGGYAMGGSRSPTPEGELQEEGEQNGQQPSGPVTVDAAARWLQEQGGRTRSPTPPRALFRSTTGKGVAFTSEDVSFLCKLLAYRKYVRYVWLTWYRS